MTNQTSEQSTPRPLAFPSGLETANGDGFGDHYVQVLRLKRQVLELERRLEAIEASECKVRNDLIATLGQNQESASERARLHEELAARERTLADVASRETAQRAEFEKLRVELRRLEIEFASAQSRGVRLGAVEAELAQTRAQAAQANANLTMLAERVQHRARLLGFLSEQLRQERRRSIEMRASLDFDARRRIQNLDDQLEAQLKFSNDEIHAAKARERAIVEAALKVRDLTQRSEQGVQLERWNASHFASASPPNVPKRRNRPARLVEKVLSRLGPFGAAIALSRSGLWKREFQTDARPTTRRTTALAYTIARKAPDTIVKALFDQRYYLENNPSVAMFGSAPLLHYLIHGDRENRSPHPLVDVTYYRAANPHDLGSTGLTVLQHFLFLGAAKGLNPHPLFDVKFYLGQLSDPHDLAMNPLVHYLRVGWRRGLNPHPLFDNDRYLAQHSDVAEMMIAPLLHYVTRGAAEGRDPHALFFSDWYRAAYSDVRTSGQNQLAHFLDRGLAERRNPNPFFNSDYYLRQAPNAQAKGLDPLQHYVQFGAWQGLSPNPDFDPVSFLGSFPTALARRITPFEAWVDAGRPATSSPTQRSEKAPSVPGVNIDPYRPALELLFDRDFYTEQAGSLLAGAHSPLEHYLHVGWRLGLNPNRLFDTFWYAARYPETLTADLPPLLHFVINGARDLQDPHPLFDSRWYVECYPDVADGNEIPLVHFLHFGAKEGRSPSPLFDTAAYSNAYPDVVDAGVKNALAHFLARWPFDNRPHDFASEAARCPEGVDAGAWVAGLADSLAESVNSLAGRNSTT